MPSLLLCCSYRNKLFGDMLILRLGATFFLTPSFFAAYMCLNSRKSNRSYTSVADPRLYVGNTPLQPAAVSLDFVKLSVRTFKKVMCIKKAFTSSGFKIPVA